MDTFYLIDFENVNNGGIENIDHLSKEAHVHIFSTKNALNIRMDLVFLNDIDIEVHIVPASKQSLDMHLVSYLGYLLGAYGKQCRCVIISKDKDYDNIIKFWKEKGCPNISRKTRIQSLTTSQRGTQQNVLQNTPQSCCEQASVPTSQELNSVIRNGLDYYFSGDDRSELNIFMQHQLIEEGYSKNTANLLCKNVIAHCNDEGMLSGIHNDITREFTENRSEVYEDVKKALYNFVNNKSKAKKREAQVRSFFGQHFKKKIYIENKENIINILLYAETKQQINNELIKVLKDSKLVSNIYQASQPLMKDLPGR